MDHSSCSPPNKALLPLILIAITLLAVVLARDFLPAISGSTDEISGTVTLSIFLNKPTFLREWFIGIGMLLCLYSGYQTLKIFQSGPSPRLIFYAGALMLFIFHIGWKNIPFWINNLHNLKAGSGLYDPKVLIPLTSSVGLFWYFINLSFLMLTILTPVILLMSICLKKSFPLKYYGSILTLMLLNFLLFQLTPDYYEWLLD